MFFFKYALIQHEQQFENLACVVLEMETGRQTNQGEERIRDVFILIEKDLKMLTATVHVVNTTTRVTVLHESHSSGRGVSKS